MFLSILISFVFANTSLADTFTPKEYVLKASVPDMGFAECMAVAQKMLMNDLRAAVPFFESKDYIVNYVTSCTPAATKLGTLKVESYLIPRDANAQSAFEAWMIANPVLVINAVPFQIHQVAAAVQLTTISSTAGAYGTVAMQKMQPSLLSITQLVHLWASHVNKRDLPGFLGFIKEQYGEVSYGDSVKLFQTIQDFVAKTSTQILFTDGSTWTPRSIGSPMVRFWKCEASPCLAE